MKILVTGEHGQLGNELRRCFETMEAEIGPIPEEYRDAEVDYIDYQVLDISDADAVDAWYAEHGPYDLTINCAAITNVDGCEQNEAAALHVNAIGAENMARAAQGCGGKIVHISTDYVFPGTNPVPRVETDAVAPISAYGRTKWEGEVLTQAACEKSFVVRTAWLYGYIGKNFVKTMLRLARENGKISVSTTRWATRQAPTIWPTRFSRSRRPMITARITVPIMVHAAGSTSLAPLWMLPASSARRRD